MRKVTVSNSNGYIRIRFIYEGRTVSVTGLGKYTDENVKDNSSLVNWIEVKLNNNEYIDVDNIKEFYIQDINKKSLIDKLKEKGNNTCRTLITIIRKFKRKVDTDEQLELFIDWLKKRGYTNGTLLRYINELKSVDYRFKKFSIKKITPQPDPFTKDEVAKIEDWFSKYEPHYLGYVIFAFNTGCRPSEIRAMRWVNINLEDRIIHVKESLTPNNVSKPPKGNIFRTVPINNKLYTVLVHMNSTRDTDKVFSTYGGTVIELNNFINRQWSVCLRECNIRYRPFKNTRHTFISHILKSTGDPAYVARITHNSKSGIDTIFTHYYGYIDNRTLPDI